MINDYLRVSSRLSHLYLLINLQHGLKDSDREILERMKHYHIKVKVVMTKADRIKGINQIYDKTISEIEKIKGVIGIGGTKSQ